MMKIKAMFGTSFLNQYEEKELNIAKHIYQYTIELFSETKLLEKNTAT